MLIKTERLTVRLIEKSDWKGMQALWEDFNASEYAVYDKPHATDEAVLRPQISRWAEANRGTEHMFFAVCLEGDLIGFYAFNITEDGYETGYCFLSDYHGRGYAKESFSAISAYLKGLGITKITAGTALKNTPSVSLLKSLGFKQTGTEKVSFYKDAEGNAIVFDGGIYELTM